jgi:phage repressor protein C with HTH and peptisase S24 domain
MEYMGERLKKARIEAGFSSASSAAKKHGWAVSTYTAHENGQNNYGPQRAKIYGKAFKTEPEWLLLGRQPMENGPGIDSQLLEMQPEMSRALIDRFNAMIEGAKIIGKVK